MNFLNPFAGISLLSGAETRSISAENPTGERAGGARADVDKWNKARKLGKGWKARPAIGLEPGQANVIADIEGPGVIQHIWITCPQEALQGTTLRMYWDGAKEPAVEAPLGDFFCQAHGLRYDVVGSLAINVNPEGGMNCFWPLPFRNRARIEIYSHLEEKLWGFFYQITYSLTDVPDNSAYFHAEYRRSITPIDAPDHVILDRVSGQGHYVGTTLGWIQRTNGWWGEGEIKFYIDGDDEYPTICGTGVEDYVGGAWGFTDRIYSAPFMGYPLRKADAGEVPRHALYRWHLPDPIRFKEDLRVTIQAIGHGPELLRFLDDDVASVAYYYLQ